MKVEERYLLFDLATDLGESKDLGGARPDLVTELGRELAEWEKQLREPMWSCRKGGRGSEHGISLQLCI